MKPPGTWALKLETYQRLASSTNLVEEGAKNNLPVFPATTLAPIYLYFIAVLGFIKPVENNSELDNKYTKNAKKNIVGSLI